MRTVLNYNRFEMLSEWPLISYTRESFEVGEVPDDFIDYFKGNAARLDGPHLESAIGFLFKVGSEAAIHLIADQLNHPLQHIRFQVFLGLDHAESVDDYVMRRIDEFCSAPERRREFGAAAVDEFRARAMKRLAT